MLTINHFQLNNEGIQLSYSTGSQNRKVVLEHRPACEVLKRIGVIKDFSEDKNHEPVIKQATGDRIAWFEFIKILSIDTTLPRKIAEHHNKHFVEDKELVLVS